MALTKTKQEYIDSGSGWINTQFGAITVKTDLITVTGAVDLDNIPSNIPSVDGEYATLAAMFVDQGNQTANYWYWVDDIDGQGTGAHYSYKGTTVGDVTDYRLAGSGSSGTVYPPMHLEYATFANLIAGQTNQKTHYFYYVTQSQTYYEYLGTTVGDITDYRGGGVVEDKWLIYLAPVNTVPALGQVTGLQKRADVNYNIVSFFLEVASAPSGGVVDVDVRKEGVSIFNTRITIPDGQLDTNAVGTTAYVANDLTWDEGETLTFYIVAINSAKTPVLTMKTTRSS